MLKGKNNEFNMGEKNRFSSTNTIIIVVLVLVIVIGGIVIGFLIGGTNSNSKGNISSKGIRKELKVFPLEPVTVNLSDENSKRYVKIKISFGYEENKKLEAELKENQDIAMDSVISIVRSKKSSEIDASHEKVIKENIKTKVNSILLNGQIEEVYFVDILIQ